MEIYTYVSLDGEYTYIELTEEEVRALGYPYIYEIIEYKGIRWLMQGCRTTT